MKAFFLLLPILLFSCQTVKTEYIYITPEIVEAPVYPTLEKPKFTDSGKGLELSYDNYRLLEKNLIDIQTYIKKLKDLIKYYEDAILLIQEKEKQ